MPVTVIEHHLWVEWREVFGAGHEWRAPHCADAACFALFKKRSAAGVRPSFGHAAPSTRGSGAGEICRNFNRAPVTQASDSVTTAMPLPASTAVIKLATLSCSSAMRGFSLA